MQASFEEKSVWIQLLSLLVALGGYFAVAGTMLSNGVDELIPFVPVFTVAVILIVLVNILGHSLAALLSRPEQRDERDRLISWRAESNSGWVVGLGVILAICCLILAVDSVWVAHLLLLSLFLSEVVRCVFQIRYYRAGM